MIATSLAALLAIGWLATALAPTAPISRFLSPWLVDWPAAKLCRLDRRHLVFLVVAIVGAQALLSIGMSDVGVALAWDVSSFIDLALIGLTLATVRNVRAAAHFLASRSRVFHRLRSRPRPRTKRAPAHRTVKAPANDDDHSARILGAARCSAAHASPG